MKQLFKLALISAFFISLTSFKMNHGDNIFKVEKNRVEVIFNRQLDFGDLVKIKLDMAQRGVVLNYNKLEFDENQKLKAIDFAVDFKDGFSGSASGDELTNQSRLGFYRDYAKGANSAFGTGYF